jgi:hypothetical protein
MGLSFCEAVPRPSPEAFATLRLRPLPAKEQGEVKERLRGRDRLGLLAIDGAVDGVDQDLGLDEFDARPLGLVAVEGGGQGFGEGVAVVGHALARLFQRLKSLAHVGIAFW